MITMMTENETRELEDIACKMIVTMRMNKSMTLHDNSTCSDLIQEQQNNNNQ